MSHSSAKLTVRAGDLAESIVVSIADEYRPSKRSTTHATAKDGNISVDFAPQEITHLRASLNSTLRLIQASHDALDATRTI